jgi:hypothetical protein
MSQDLHLKLKPGGEQSKKMNNKEDEKRNAMKIKNPVVRNSII